MKPIEISIRELHARTGHYVRKAAAHGLVIVTDRGKRMAELHPISRGTADEQGERWRDRVLLPEFREVADDWVGGTDSARMVEEDRDRG